MKKLHLFNILLFAFVWIGFNYASGVFDHIHELPRGIHQSAQCDRAALAQNYYYGGFRFFYPEVNENRCIDGIVSVEMPLVSFTAAGLYALFEYDEFWYRALSFSLFSIGMMALFFLFKTRLNTLTSLSLCILIHASPLLLFYGANFLPDISALGFILMAWWAFYRIHVKHAFLPYIKSVWLQVAMVLCLGIGIATKTTALIQWLTMAGVFILSYFPFFKIEIAQKKKLLLSLCLSLAIPLAWYFWSLHLAATHNSQYFMMGLPQSESWEGYQQAWHVYLANWPDQLFTHPLISIAVALLALPLILKRYIQKELLAISILNTIGSLAFMAIMIEQFKYHDYYAICLFPVFALNWLALSDATKKLTSKFWWVKVSFFILIILAVNYQFNQGKKSLEARYTEGNYWEQSHHSAADFEVFRKQIHSLGANRQACVLVGYDVAPNNMLYLLHLRGHRIAKDHDQARLKYVLSGAHPRYMVSNDSSFATAVNRLVDSCVLLSKYNQLELYELKY